jgi:hypothetical protein
MTPTLVGRIQTRIFLALVIGIPWTLIVTPFLPGNRSGFTMGEVATNLYPVTFTALAVIVVVGCVLWELIYHGLQQYRWERDWPIMFFLLLVIPEAILAWFVLRAIGPESEGIATGATFVVHIVSTWVLMWLFVIGPIRIFLIRYRFRGGRILGGW